MPGRRAALDRAQEQPLEAPLAVAHLEQRVLDAPQVEVPALAHVPRQQALDLAQGVEARSQARELADAAQQQEQGHQAGRGDEQQGGPEPGQAREQPGLERGRRLRRGFACLEGHGAGRAS